MLIDFPELPLYIAQFQKRHPIRKKFLMSDIPAEKETPWRMTLAVMFLAQFSAGLGFSFVLPFFPFYFRELGVATEEQVLLWIGWSSVAFGVTMTFSAQFWGILADRYGRKIMVLRSMIAGSIILGAMGFARNPWHLLFLRIMQGAATGTVSASVTLVSSITPSASLGFSMGVMSTSIFLGQAAGQFFGGILAEHFGFRLPCVIASVLLFMGALIVYFGATEIFTPEEKKTDGLKTIRGLLDVKGFKAILLVYFLIYTLSTMIYPILPLYIEKLAGDNARAISLTGIILAVTAILTGVSAMLYGKISDRFGKTRILVISLILTGLVSIPQSFAQTTGVLFFERCLFGLAVGGILPTVNAIVSNIISREKIGSAYGMTSAVTCLGIGMGPMLGSILATMMGLRAPFAVLGVFSFAVAWLVYSVFSKLEQVNR